MQKKLIFLSFFCALLFQGITCAVAQWKNVAPQLLGDIYTAQPYPGYSYGGAMTFHDGIVWVGKTELWKSSDLGTTWTKCTPMLKGEESVILDIDFIDQLNGVVSTSEFLYLTNDGGLSWKHLKDPVGRSKGQECFSSFFLGSPQKLVCCYGGIWLSSDAGLTWEIKVKDLLYDVMKGIWLKDGVAYVKVAETDRASTLYFTTNYGITWDAGFGSFDYDSYSFDVDKLDYSTVYVANEDGITTYDGKSNIFVSSDRGDSWTKAASRPTDTHNAAPFFCGSVSSAATATYMQTTTEGIWRSTDKGKNWKSIGGPNMSYDTRFVQAACENIVFAVDSFGSIWATFNSGGDPVGPGGSVGSGHFSSARIINDSFNVTIHLPIYFHHSGTMSDVDMIMHYPTISLKLASTTLYNGKSFDVTGSQWPGRAALHFNAADLNTAPDSLLGYVNFQWTPFEFACDPVDFDSIDTHSSEAPCSSSIEAQPFKGIIGSFKTCGLTSGVTENEINATPPCFSIHPNPARSNIQIEIANDPGKLQYELFDALGIVQRKGLTSEKQFKVDIIGLPSGNYYLRINREKGGATTKRLIIEN